MIRYLIKTKDVNGFIVELSEECAAYVKFKLYYVDGDQHKLMMDGWQKWDGCSDTTYNNSIHFCGGLDDWATFTQAVEFMLKKAKELIEGGREHNSDLEDWPHDYVLIISEFKDDIVLRD
jgi:hypothetical protein